MSKPKYPLCFDPLCEEHNQATPTDTEILDWLEKNRIGFWTSWGQATGMGSGLSPTFEGWGSGAMSSDQLWPSLRAAVIAAMSHRETR